MVGIGDREHPTDKCQPQRIKQESDVETIAERENNRGAITPGAMR